jgi:hypothetical protein
VNINTEFFLSHGHCRRNPKSTNVFLECEATKHFGFAHTFLHIQFCNWQVVCAFQQYQRIFVSINVQLSSPTWKLGRPCVWSNVGGIMDK